MFVDNQMNFGYLIDAKNYTKGKLHNDLWQTMENPQVSLETQHVYYFYFEICFISHQKGVHHWYKLYLNFSTFNYIKKPATC